MYTYGLVVYSFKFRITLCRLNPIMYVITTTAVTKLKHQLKKSTGFLHCELINKSWYWVWSESSVYDFFVSTLVHRLVTTLTTLLPLATMFGFLEFFFFLKIQSLNKHVAALNKIYGIKYIISLAVTLITIPVVLILLLT